MLRLTGCSLGLTPTMKEDIFARGKQEGGRCKVERKAYKTFEQLTADFSWRVLTGDGDPDLSLPPLRCQMMLGSTSMACPILMTEKGDVDRTCSKEMKGMIYAVTLTFTPTE